MPFQGFVDGKDIENLSADSFRTVMNRILEVEAIARGVPLTRLDLSTRNNDPDAGVDGRVEWPLGDASEILLAGENVLQYKAGKLTRAILKSELSQPGVKKCLDAGGNYIISVGHDYNPTDAKKWRAELAKLMRSRKKDPKKCRILFGSDIARIASCYPSVIVLPELKKDIPLLLTVNRWARGHDLKWTPDEARLEVIKRIRSFLADQKHGQVLRIEGPAGVGKTRVVLEAVREHGIAEISIYAGNSDDNHVQELLTFLVGNERSYATIVADECSTDRQNVLHSFVESCGGRVKLICVGTPDLLSPPLASSASLIRLEGLADEQIQEILNHIKQPVPKEIIDAAVRVAKGFVKLAIFVAKQLVEQRDLDLHELSRIGDVGTFLRRFVRAEVRGVLEAFSLLARLGWRDELSIEAESVAAYLKIEMKQMKLQASYLRPQGVLMDQGRYCYVSPDLLAVFAAAQLWEREGPELIKILESLPSRKACFELLRRIAMMGEHPDVKQAVERMLQPDGVYKSLDDLDDEFRSEMLRILASALPKAATNVINQIIDKVDIAKLLDFKVGRRNVIWTLESLLRWPTTSVEAAQSLAKLARGENEKIGNNATAIFRQFFHVYLSGTPIAYAERLPLLDRLISEGTRESLQLAISAMSAGLQHDESRMGGNVDDVSGRPYPPEWQPKTWGEVWDARKALISRLMSLTARSDSVGQQAREVLIGSVFTLIRDGMWSDAITALANTKPTSDSERRAMLDATKRIEREVGAKLGPEERERVNEIQRNCFDESFSSRLRRWAGKHIHADYDLEGHTGFSAADTEVQKIAEVGYKEGIPDDDLKWLGSREAENAWQFGQRLGELDAHSEYLSKILESSQRDINPLFLAGYLSGQQQSRGLDFREMVLDKLAKNEPLLAFAATWRGAPTPKGLNRALMLVDSGALAPEILGYLAFSGWTNSFSASDIKELLERLLRGPAQKTLDPAMGIALGLLQRDPYAFGTIEALLWQMIEVKPEQAWSWEWERLAEVLTPRNPRRITATVLSFFDDKDYLCYTHSPERKALFSAAQVNPKESWELIAAVLSRMDSTTHRLLLALDESYGELIPTDVLVEWAKEHLPQGPGIVAQMVSIKAGNLPQRARTLLRTFKDNKYVQSAIAGQLSSGSWTGPFSGRIKYELEIAEGWAKDADPAVRQFAKGVVTGLKQRLKQQIVREEEGSYM
jgi:hypothetical protein